jgi:hypothetical protein
MLLTSNDLVATAKAREPFLDQRGENHRTSRWAIYLAQSFVVIDIIN